MSTAEYNLGVDAYADGLYRFMLKLCKDSDWAQDLVQEAFEKVWLKRSEVEGDKFKSYVFKTGYNLFVNQLQRASKFEPYGKNTFTEAGEHISENFDLKAALDKALDTLPQIQKTVVLLRDYEGYSYEEIAELTELRLPQVKVYIFRARQSLKVKLAHLEHLV